MVLLHRFDYHSERGPGNTARAGGRTNEERRRGGSHTNHSTLRQPIGPEKGFKMYIYVTDPTFAKSSQDKVLIYLSIVLILVDHLIAYLDELLQ